LLGAFPFLHFPFPPPYLWGRSPCLLLPPKFFILLLHPLILSHVFLLVPLLCPIQLGMFCLQLSESHLDGGNGNHAFSQFDVICSITGPIYMLWHGLSLKLLFGLLGHFFKW
jgi:hypothetical protein